VKYRPDADLLAKYRPRKLRDIVGQSAIVRALEFFAAHPYSKGMIYAGSPGIGKSAAALALADALGVVTGPGIYSMGGLHQIASGSQGAPEVRALMDSLHSMPMYGSGWRVVIINEADRMTAGAEAIWLDALEQLPPKTVIVFTTNDASALSQRFRERCESFQFQSAASDEMRDAVRQLTRRVCEAETGSPDTIRPETLRGIVVTETPKGGEPIRHVSFRRVVNAIGEMLRERAASLEGSAA
jgi:replication-associated recombination protein RarA